MEKAKNENDDPLAPLRHSAEHILQIAVKQAFPQVKRVMGPPIENGFYFDFNPEGEKVSVEDFEKLEGIMTKLRETNLSIEVKEVEANEAEKLFAGNQYKLDHIKEIVERGEKPSICVFGKEGDEFYDVDLCMGPHVKSTGKVEAFKLLSIAGAYYKGDEKNTMLTRIYGTAFESQEALDKHLELLEEAKHRDHRKIGKELELFTFSDEIGPGLPLWMPKGTVIKEELEKWGKETEDKWGYQRVATPFIAKRKLFETSSHIPYFEDEMYKVTVPGDEEEEYFIRPMNCPFHHKIYASRPRSYRELPLKLAEYGTVARYENRGALNGILRPRVFCQNDAHIYCTQEQAIDAFVEVVDLHRYYYDKLGLKDHYIVLELRDPEKMDKYHGNEEMWELAEKLSCEAMEKAGVKYKVVNEGAAHYGPKMDFKIKSVIGTEYGISTNQIDLYMPERFGLTYIDKDGQEKPVIVQHRSPLGSSERFVGFLIEHFAGAFPVWLSPVQAVIIPISDKQLGYAKKVAATLKEKGLRVDVDGRSETMQAKIRDAQMQKVPYMLVVGEREEEKDQVSVRLRTGEDLKAKDLTEVAEKLTNIYLTKSLNLW